MKQDNYRQQLFVLIVNHSCKHAEMAAEIFDAVSNIPGVQSLGILVDGDQGETVVNDGMKQHEVLQ